MGPDASLRFCHACRVAYAMQSAVEEKLDRLERENVVTLVQFSDWAAPIVPVMKKDGKTVRICGNLKLIVNQASKLDQYPIPLILDLFATLAGGTFFSTLDMSQAYWQIELDELSQKCVTISIHKGLQSYKCLSFGVELAAGIFQRVMGSLLRASQVSQYT